MSETHHDPVMRPSVDHLLFQLKNHKALKNHPDAVELVIKRMAYHFFRFEEERPARLFHTIDDLMYQFLAMMGGGYPEANDERMLAFRYGRGGSGKSYFGVELKGEGTGGNAEAILWPMGSPERYEQELLARLQPGLSPGEAPQGETGNPESKMGIKKVLEEGDKEKGEASGIFAHPTPQIDMDDPDLRLGVEGVIAKHILDSDPGGSAALCSCGRPYPSEEKWAKHVRIRIWRYLQNEFKGDD